MAERCLPHPAPVRRTGTAGRRLSRLVLLGLALLLVAPTGRAWIMQQQGPVHANVKVNESTDPDEPSSASVFVCSDHDPVTKVDAKLDPGLVTVWVPEGPDDSGSRRTTAGCGEDQTPVEVTVWVDRNQLFA